MAEKWQVGIYLIHNSNKITEDVYNTLVDTSKTYEQKQRKLLSKLLFVDDAYKYGAQKLINNQIDPFELYLFYRKHKKNKPEWKDFFNSQVDINASMKTDPVNMNESFVFFLYHKISRKLYAICGGYGSFTIQKFIDDDFGINILIRIIQNKGEKILRHAKEFGITGGIVGISKYFRQNYNFHENKNFGNIYREISAQVDKDIANNLGIITDDNKQCIAKNSFKINQSINYSEMLKVVKELDLIMQRSANFDINDITKIDKNKNEKLIKELEKLVIDSLWNNRNNLVALDEALDFIHKDFENFLKASKFKFAKTYHENNETLFKTIISKFTDITKDEFEKKLKSFSVVSLDEEETELTKETIYNHLVYEINHLTKSYFLINGTYYEITSNFKNSLNESCKNFITENYDNGLNKAWDNTDTEGVYNLSYKGENSTIVLDTITPENIESCDILKYDDNFVYLYHVKKGFNGSMRDLTNQVFISANRILEDINTSKTYLKSIYRKMQLTDNYKNQVQNEAEFLSIFNGKKLCFVIAIKDSGATGRSIQNIQSFSSNIAKFALNELINNMNNLGVKLKITQIN